MILNKSEIEDQIVCIMRQYFLKYSDEVLEKYRDQINSTISWYVSNLPRHVAQTESDDLSSEARIAFMDAIKTWDPRKGELWPYVSVRLKGAMQDYLRKRGNDPVAGIYDFVTSAANVYLAFNKSIVHHDRMEEKLNIDAGLKHLNEKERAIITGYYKHDKTFKKIGEDIGLSESQVSRICKEATDKLKDFLKNPPEEEH